MKTLIAAGLLMMSFQAQATLLEGWGNCQDRAKIERIVAPRKDNGNLGFKVTPKGLVTGNDKEALKDCYGIQDLRTSAYMIFCEDSKYKMIVIDSKQTTCDIYPSPAGSDEIGRAAFTGKLMK